MNAEILELVKTGQIDFDDEDLQMLTLLEDADFDDFFSTPYDSDSSSSSESSENNEKNAPKEKQKSTIDEILPEFTDDNFRESFGMSWQTCEYLIALVQEAESKNREGNMHAGGRPSISTTKAVLLTLWYLATNDTFTQLEEKFKMTKSCAHKHITKIVSYLVDISPQYITWPSNEEAEEISKVFYKNSGISNVVGAIDACYIRIPKPIKNHGTYYNANGEYSFILQGVVDHRHKFIDVFCGEVGSSSHKTVLEKSSLYERCCKGLTSNRFILGDANYPPLRWLLSPFRNPVLSKDQIAFNEQLAATRSIIGDSFSVLKQRFKRLTNVSNTNNKMTVDYAVACCVLHNICIDLNDSDLVVTNS